MVDALRRAHSLLDSGGMVVDIHPTPAPAHLDIATGSEFVRLADRLDDGTPSGPRRRHMAADAAVVAGVSSGMFTREGATEFTFRTHADTVDELLDYLQTKWKQLHFAAADLTRARDHLARRHGTAIVVTERVTACRLARASPPHARAGHDKQR
jgi:hypothetical protein